ncbi:COG3904 family protein [Methylovirgula sp. 4M-Z18]|uniref:COG3904 family protein n=1 Tax=Methylovirgula sp. 4M-Z18 TaxID=2293567 RepID=UPI000E2FC8A2|nr:hypothetical protein [Methylovirgula sp. 4M-Z18]RFB78809.1 hypothetical protein DYH55_13285 [Methylovirgula sp. 4M-Z18]
MAARTIILKLLVFLALTLCLGSASAQPLLGDKDPMRVVIVSGDDPNCTGHCPRWISAQGNITETTPADFARVLQAMGKDKLPIVIHSSGGVVPAALEIGRMIRAHGLEIAVGQTSFFGCEPRDKDCVKEPGFAGFRGTISSASAVCASACGFLFAGGVQRHVGMHDFIGVHQMSQELTHVTTHYMLHVLKYANGHRVVASRDIVDQTSWTEGPKAETSPAQYSNVSVYLTQMGIGNGLVPMMLATPNTSIHWMTRAELFDASMATDSTDARQWIASIGNDALATYHASPDYRTLTYAHALLRMGQGADGPILLSLDFAYRHNDGVVSLTATPTSNGKLVESSPANVFVAMPKGQLEVASEASRNSVSEPLTVSIRKREFCDLARDGRIRVAFESGHTPNDTRLSLAADVRTFSSMPGLLEEACGDFTPAQANVASRNDGALY